jgi:dihydroorotase
MIKSASLARMTKFEKDENKALSETFDLVLKNGTCVTPSGIVATDIGVVGGRIAAIGDLAAGTKAVETLDLSGLHVLPGVIDTQVHFREPGNAHKEDLETGTAAAVLGGVTGVFEMPNTSPPTTSAAALADKCRRAKDRAWCNIAFYVGATPENAEELESLEKLPGCAGVKIFMGSSTGTLLVAEDAALARVLASGSRRCAVHCEDEARLSERKALITKDGGVHQHPQWRDAKTAFLATERLLALAEGAKRKVHVLHVTTAEEMDLLRRHHQIASVEVTPQHLTFAAPDVYDRLGSLGQMNPPIRDQAHQDALWRAINDGLVDVIGSDHAPHTREEKAAPYPESPSGMPGVQTLVPIMLNHVAEGRLSLERFVDLTSTGAARLFGILGKGRIATGFDADFTIVDLASKRTITDLWIASRCGWTPYHDLKVTGWPIYTLISGRIVMGEGEMNGPPMGGTFTFSESLGL